MPKVNEAARPAPSPSPLRPVPAASRPPPNPMAALRSRIGISGVRAVIQLNGEGKRPLEQEGSDPGAPEGAHSEKKARVVPPPPSEEPSSSPASGAAALSPRDWGEDIEQGQVAEPGAMLSRDTASALSPSLPSPEAISSPPPLLAPSFARVRTAKEEDEAAARRGEDLARQGFAQVGPSRAALVKFMMLPPADAKAGGPLSDRPATPKGVLRAPKGDLEQWDKDAGLVEARLSINNEQRIYSYLNVGGHHAEEILIRDFKHATQRYLWDYGEAIREINIGITLSPCDSRAATHDPADKSCADALLALREEFSDIPTWKLDYWDVFEGKDKSKAYAHHAAVGKLEKSPEGSPRFQIRNRSKESCVAMLPAPAAPSAPLISVSPAPPAPAPTSSQTPSISAPRAVRAAAAPAQPQVAALSTPSPAPAPPASGPSSAAAGAEPRTGS